MARILVVDDEELVCWALERAFKRDGHDVAVASTAEDALKQAGATAPDVVFLDVRLPGMDGLTALGELRKLTPGAAVVVATAFGNLSTAVGAEQGGAFDYLIKPYDLSQALDAVHRAIERRGQPPAPPAPEEAAAGEEIIGRGPAMQTVFKRIALVAPRDSCVLITGESGTGKELVARAIHRHSSRRDKPFLPVHIAALNPGLVESELFGHVKGAFTGAAGPSTGILALADGGTVFLDELADIPLAVQVKLLRVLEYGEVTPVGGTQPHILNLRILSATHQDLTRAVADGRFRHDLYFRLNGFTIHLPALRDRLEDLPLLADHFLRRFQPGSLPLQPGTVKYLGTLPWPGNIRELRGALEHAAIIARGGPLHPEHFPAAASGSSPTDPASQVHRAVRQWLESQVAEAGTTPPDDLYGRVLQLVEPVLIGEVLRKTQGNRWAAARWLGLNRATVRKKIGQYGLEPEAPNGDRDDSTDAEE